MRSVGLALGITVLVSLAHAQAPVVNAGGVVNNGNYSSQGVAPGSIIAVFGTNMALNLAIGSTIPLSTSLDTVQSVTFNGVKAGLFFVGNNQLDAQLPFESLPDGASSNSVNIVVTTSGGGASVPVAVNVLPSVPGIFTANESGVGQAVATDNADGAWAAATGSIAGITSHPFSITTQGTNAHALIIWCTGLGAVNPPIADGANSYNADGSVTVRNTVVTPVVLVGGVKAQVIFSGLAPGFVGEYQVDLLLGTGTPTGNAVPVQIQMNGITTSDQVTVAVGN